MTLYLINMSRPRTIFLNVAPDLINFFWRTGGGAHCSIITAFPDKVIEVYKQKYNIKEKDYGIEEMPRDPKEFFEILSRFIELKWRRLDDNTIEVAVVAVGKFIGAGHRNVKAIEEHLGLGIKVTPAVELLFHSWFEQYIDKHYNVYEFPENCVVKEKLNPHYGFRRESVWVAPWCLKKVGAIPDEKLWKRYVEPEFRIAFENIELDAVVIENRRPIDPVIARKFKDRLYVKKVHPEPREMWIVVRRPTNGIIRVRKADAGHIIGKKGQRIKEIARYFGFKELKVEIVY